ncbi:MAG: hypothetical protein LC790_10025, partial [Actinobacteria bacterium]|nr:hypothetical protein [Actinomycetota bacterium]
RRSRISSRPHRARAMPATSGIALAGVRGSRRTDALPSCASVMIAASRTAWRVMQLRLDLTEGPAPAAALWELVGEEQREAAMAILAALIAQSALARETGDE